MKLFIVYIDLLYLTYNEGIAIVVDQIGVEVFIECEEKGRCGYLEGEGECYYVENLEDEG